jgi:nicotinamidase-related amidase
MAGDKVRHKSRHGLLLVDVINHFEFSDGKQILRNALKVAGRAKMLKTRARKANVPVIYVNDNFGQWRSDATKLLAYCLQTQCAGQPS